LCVIVFATWVSLFAAPAPAAAQNAPDVEVSDLQWTYDVNRDGRLKGYYQRPPVASPDPVQRVAATFRNNGAKPVKAVTWEYVAYSDSDPSRVVRVYKFDGKARLRPGESARLSEQGLNIQHRRRVEARVVGVEYEDGTVWRRAKP
jgi:hypothetical protein